MSGNREQLKEEERAFLTVAEAAQRLRLSVSMIYKEIAANRMPHYRFGTRVRITVAGLREYVANRHVESELAPGDSVTSHLDL